MLGKLNTHEFAYGALTTSPHFGPARNPWSPDRVCGGSSGGSGAAAAADLAAGTLGTDTAGSIRIPCMLLRRHRTAAVAGPRPEPGRRPDLVDVRHGRTDREERRGLQPAPRGARPVVPSGTGRRRWRSLRRRRRTPLSSAEPDIQRVRDRRWTSSSCSARTSSRSSIPLLEEAGTIVQAIMLPEATQAHLGWLRTRLPDYGPDVRARLLAGLLLPSTAYVTGLRARRWYLNELRPVFERFDLLVHPAMPVIPPRIGEDGVPAWGGGPVPARADPVQLTLFGPGRPVASVRAASSRTMPAGLALVGRPSGEATVLRVAATFQHVTDWHRRRPQATVGTESR